MVIPTMPVKIKASGLSDVGLIRHNNEDVWAQLPEDHFYVLADGMGGHQAGEVAAREAVNALCQSFKKMRSKGQKSFYEAPLVIERSIEHANSVVYKMGRSHEMLRGMGTTLCCLYFHDEGLVYGHVGDSRIYCLRDTKLTQLTHDHSLVTELVELGQLNEHQVSDFLYKNIITKAIGTEPHVEPSVDTIDLKKGDKFLMCTDGLSDLLTVNEIEAILNQNKDNEEASEQLVSCAKARGGHDNITVVLIEVSQI